jgi:hypothetical protein
MSGSYLSRIPNDVIIQFMRDVMRIGEHEPEDGEVGRNLVLQVGDEPQCAVLIKQGEDDCAADGEQDRSRERDD